MAKVRSTIAMCVLAGLGLAAQHPIPSPQELPTVKLSAELVLLNLTVTGPDQKYVGKLDQQDFRLWEDGEPQQIAFYGNQETPFAAAILVDVSGSMERMLRIACAAARNFAEKLRGEDVFAVYVFADKVARIQDFGSAPELDEIIWNIEAEGYTALYDSITQAVTDLGRRQERRRAVLVLSDGADNRSRATLDSCLQLASDASVTVYTVNLMDPLTSRRTDSVMAAAALRGMADRTGGRYIDDPGGARMYQAFQEIVQELSQQYTIGYYPAPEKRDGKWHKIRVEVSQPKTTVRTREGYRAPKG